MTKMPLDVHFCYKVKLILNPQVKTPDHNVPICSVKSHYVKQGLIRDKRKKRDGAGLVMLHVHAPLLHCKISCHHGELQYVLWSSIMVQWKRIR